MDPNDSSTASSGSMRMAAAPFGLSDSTTPPTKSSAEDLALVVALRAGDETAFMTLVNRYQPSLYRLALTYVHDPAVAQEVVQDTWLGVLKGIDRFEARASLKTWIFRILINRAKTSATREGRQIPFSEAWDAADDADEPALEPERFQSLDGSGGRGWWVAPPTDWGVSPEEGLLANETRAQIERAVATLPETQREVITLRDIEGLPSAEVCNLLHLTETNQRVLLHRARSRVRRALERYFGEER